MRILQPAQAAGTFSTSVTTPLVIGGTTASSSLTLQSTSGVGTTDFVVIKVGNNGATEAMRIITNGRVGIGQAAPNALLDVNGGDFWFGDTANTARAITFRRNGATVGSISTSSSVLTFGGGSSGSALDIDGNQLVRLFNGAVDGPILRLSNTRTAIGAAELLGALEFFSTDSSGIGAGVRGFLKCTENDSGTGRAYDLIFGTGNNTVASEKVRITKTGTVGIGSTTPAAELHVSSTATGTVRGLLSAQYNTGTHGAQLLSRKARGTEAAPTIIVTGDTLGSWIGSGYDGAAYLQMGAINIDSTGTIGTNRVPTQIVFKTATDAATSVLTTALTLTADQSATFVGRIASIGHTITSASATALVVGVTGATDPAFQVDASTASGVGGLKVTSNITTQGVTLSALGTNANENLLIICKGAGVTTLDTGNSNAGTEVRLRVGNLTKLSIIPASTAFTTSARTSGATTYWSVTGGADTTLTASTEALDVNFNLAQTKQHATGALTLQRHMLINAPTDGFVGASVVTDDATLAIDGPPSGGTNATLTTTQALLIQTRVVANSTNAYGMVVNAPSGAGTINGAALFVGSVATTGTVAATGIITPISATTITASGVQAIKLGSGTVPGIYVGSGSPNGVTTAAKGSIYIRSDGSGAADRAYVNSDAGTTWTAIVTVA